MLGPLLESRSASYSYGPRSRLPNHSEPDFPYLKTGPLVFIPQRRTAGTELGVPEPGRRGDD